MNFKKISKIMAILMSVVTLVSCGNVKGEEKPSNSETTNKDSNGKEILNIWSYFPIGDELISDFEEQNPNTKINVKIFDYEEYEVAYKESLLDEDGSADILMIDSNDYGSFNSIKGLEDLLSEEYNVEDYKNNYDKELWELGKSMDKKELVGLPIASAPIVTYYRADIMEKYGFPSEPYELAKFMENRDNWIKIGETLAKDGIHIVQWVGEIIRISTSNMAYFNEKLEYQRDNDNFKEAISIAREARNKGLSPYADIWSEQGTKMMKDGKFAMLYLGSWGSNELKGMVPEQSGKWRVTSLPFGLYGWSNASILSIAKNSKNKEVAWDFLEFYAFKHSAEGGIGSVSGYLPFRGKESMLNHRNDFLGGQQEQKLYEEIMKLTEEHSVTALDNEAFKIWERAVNEGLENEKTDEEIMYNIKKEIEERFKREREILLEER